MELAARWDYCVSFGGCVLLYYLFIGDILPQNAWAYGMPGRPGKK